jgi:hypothetical protein
MKREKRKGKKDKEIRRKEKKEEEREKRISKGDKEIERKTKLERSLP